MRVRSRDLLKVHIQANRGKERETASNDIATTHRPHTITKGITMKEYVCSHHNFSELEEIVNDLRREAYHARTIDNAIANEENETAKCDLSYTLTVIIDNILTRAEDLDTWFDCLGKGIDMNAEEVSA